MRRVVVLTACITVAALATAIGLSLLLIRGVKPVTKVGVGGTFVFAKIAKSDADRARGLSGTSSLGRDQAMLFVFDYPAEWQFWMKDMSYNIDILWLNDGKTVVDEVTNVSPSGYPQQIFTPKENARYVLELPAGFAHQHDVRIGAQTTFSFQ